MERVRTRIKFCGITSVEDARAAVAAGADAIGLVFYPRSSRYVGLVQAAEIAAAIPAFVTVTGLFVNPAVEEVNAALAGVRLDLLQFHGDEDEVFCQGFGRPYMKALRMSPGKDPVRESARFPRAAAILLDAWHPEMPGGSGERFDWQRVSPSFCRDRLVLAGGLDAGNVAEAIDCVSPYAVDVSSGIEDAPGRKSAVKMQQFVAAVNAKRR